MEEKKEITKEEFQNALEEGKRKVMHRILSEFTEKNALPMWPNYSAVSKFKSVRRAIRRGRVDLFTGIIYPTRPFNNRKHTSGRKINTLKQQIHGELKADRAI